MDSLLCPVMASMFIIYFESFLQGYNLIGMKYWSRYVDDVFVIFYIKPDVTTILQELNIIHGNIKFSYEPEINGIQHFLDVNVRYNDGKFLTNTYSKPTNTGLFTLYGLVLHQNCTSLIYFLAYFNDHIEFVQTKLILHQK